MAMTDERDEKDTTMSANPAGAPTGRPSTPAVPADGDDLTRGQALSQAWVIWLTLIATILIGAVAVLWYLFMFKGEDVRTADDGGMAGFYLGMALLALSMGGFFVKRVYHGAYFRGELVEPHRYLKGMLAIWLPIGGTALASLALSVVFANPLPTPVPALVATILLFTFRPNGSAMTKHAGGSDDPGSYEEPK